MNLIKKLRQAFCAHEVYYMETMTARDVNGNVHATCDKCGKELVADCGLHLDAKLLQRATRSRKTP